MTKRNAINAFRNTFILLAMSIAGLAGESIGQSGFTYEENVDRMGGDIRSINLPEAKPELCLNACLQQKGCKAYTYVKPGYQASNARCWLKNSKPRKLLNQSCCISGADMVKSKWAGAWWAYSFGNVYLEQDEFDQLSGKFSDGGGYIKGAEDLDGNFYFTYQYADGKTVGQGLWFLSGNRYGGKRCYGFGCTPDGGYDVARR